MGAVIATAVGRSLDTPAPTAFSRLMPVESSGAFEVTDLK